MYKFLNNLYIYFSTNILAKFVIGFAGILLARFLSKEDFGTLKTITTFFGLIGIFVNFGFNDLMLFRMSKNTKSLIKIEVFKAFLTIYILFFPICLGLFFSIYGHTIIGTFFVILFYVKLFFDWMTDINNRILQAKNKFSLISFLVLVNSLLTFCAVLVLYILKKSLSFYVVEILIISIISATLSVILSNEWNFQVLKKLLEKPFRLKSILFKSAFPFFTSALMAYIYMQSDILMLSIMASSKEVSRYAVVTSLIFSAYLIPSILYSYFLPKFTSYFKKKLKLINIYKQFSIYTFILVFPLGLFLFLFAKEILKFLYTYKYLDSFMILKILSIVFIFHSFCFLFGALLTASGNQVVRSKIQFLAAVVNIFFNLILIPFYKAEGAALATAITEIVIFAMYFYFAIKTWRINYV